MPKKLILQKNINDWEQYAGNLNKYQFVKKYLEGIFKKWVEHQGNPLEIIWIQNLFLSKLNYLENNLNQVQNNLGTDNLLSLLSEIKTQGGKPKAINDKITSIQGEIITYFELKKLGHNNIRKIHEIGDWESDSSIISVKSFTSLDENYQSIENQIRGLHLIFENSVLRKYNHIMLSNQSNLDHMFLNHLTELLEKTFISTINYVDNIENNTYCYIHLFKTFCQNNDSINSHMRIEVYPLIDGNIRSILFMFIENRPNESSELYHRININLLDHTKDKKDVFGISTDLDSFRSGEIIAIKKLIKLKLPLFEKAYNRSNSNKEFIGWINIPIAVKHQEHIVKNLDKIKVDLSSLTEKINYQIIVCLIPDFLDELNEITLFTL